MLTPTEYVFAERLIDGGRINKQNLLPIDNRLGTHTGTHAYMRARAHTHTYIIQVHTQTHTHTYTPIHNKQTCNVCVCVCKVNRYNRVICLLPEIFK